MGSILPIDYTRPIFPRRNVKGYLYFIDKQHPLAMQDGIVYLHRHLASVKLGRWLSSAEHVHHADHDRLNNSGENLVILTATGHAQLHAAEQRKWGEQTCPVCDSIFTPSHSGRVCCSRGCQGQRSRRFDISKEELQRRVWEAPAEELAKELGVSGAAIAKRCKKLGVTKPPRGYWAKQRSGSSTG